MALPFGELRNTRQTLVTTDYIATALGTYAGCEGKFTVRSFLLYLQGPRKETPGIAAALDKDIITSYELDYTCYGRAVRMRIRILFG